MRVRLVLVTPLLGLMAGGCVEQVLTVDTKPQGALVYMNDQEVGRTPIRKDFVWHGNYDVEVRKEGYETLKTTGRVRASWWNTVPLDLLAELIPLRFHDEQRLSYTLRAASTQPVEAGDIMTRAENLEARLEGSKYPQPATKPSVFKSKKP